MFSRELSWRENDNGRKSKMSEGRGNVTALTQKWKCPKCRALVKWKSLNGMLENVSWLSKWKAQIMSLEKRLKSINEINGNNQQRNDTVSAIMIMKMSSLCTCVNRHRNKWKKWRNDSLSWNETLENEIMSYRLSHRHRLNGINNGSLKEGNISLSLSTLSLQIIVKWRRNLSLSFSLKWKTNNVLTLSLCKWRNEETNKMKWNIFLKWYSQNSSWLWKTLLSENEIMWRERKWRGKKSLSEMEISRQSKKLWKCVHLIERNVSLSLSW